MFNLTVLF